MAAAVLSQSITLSSLTLPREATCDTLAILASKHQTHVGVCTVMYALQVAVHIA